MTSIIYTLLKKYQVSKLLKLLVMKVFLIVPSSLMLIVITFTSFCQSWIFQARLDNSTIASVSKFWGLQQIIIVRFASSGVVRGQLVVLWLQDIITIFGLTKL